MPVDAGEKPLKPTRYSLLRSLLDAFARLFLWKPDRIK